MIKIIEQGQKTFIRTCDRCGCKFQYDLSDLGGLDYINCPCCHTTLTHIGPKAVKIDLSKTNCIGAEEMRKNPVITPNKIEVGDAGYNYTTTTGRYVNPSTVTTISDVTKPSTITGGDPNATIYANKLPDDIVDDPYNNIGMSLPDDIKDNCYYESDDYKAWHEKWCKEIQDNKPIKCKK